MSEKVSHHSPEHHQPRHEQESRHEQAEKLKHIQEKAERAEHTSQDNLDQIKQSIEAAAVSGKEYSRAEKETPRQTTQHGVNKALKASAYRRVIKKTQSQLSTPERTLSRTIHNPAVEKASEVAAKTVARPSGILFGGIGAFAGTVIVLFISKRVGFTYNYSLFFLLFLGGYILGIVLEFILRSIKKLGR